MMNGGWSGREWQRGEEDMGKHHSAGDETQGMFAVSDVAGLAWPESPGLGLA